MKICQPRGAGAVDEDVDAATFGIRGRGDAARHQLHGLLLFGFGLAISSGSLFVLHRFDPTVGKAVELSVLVVANLVATLIRFVTLRRLFSAGDRVAVHYSCARAAVQELQKGPG